MKRVHAFAQFVSLVVAVAFCLVVNGSVLGLVASASGLAAFGLYLHAPILYAATTVGVYGGYFALRRRRSSLVATFVVLMLFSLLTIMLTLEGAFLEFPSAANDLETKRGLSTLAAQYVLALVLWQSLGTAAIFAFVGYVRIGWRSLRGKPIEEPGGRVPIGR